MTANGYTKDEQAKLFPRYASGGIFFNVTDDFLLHYLKNKIMGTNHPDDIIHEFDLYGFDHPRYLPAMLPMNVTEKHEKIFYTLIPERYIINGEKMERRVIKDGEWRATGYTENIPESPEFDGRMVTFVFVDGNGSTARETSWLMQEFSLYPTSALNDPDLKTKLERYVVVKILNKGDLSNEEEDDEDENLDSDYDESAEYEDEEEEEEEDEDQNS